MTESLSPTPSREREFAALLARLVDDLADGKLVTLATVCEAYPEFELELRDVWGTLVVTRAAGSASAADLESVDSASLSHQQIFPCDLGDYTLNQEISRGGMGIVYRATRNQDQQPIALKVILKGEFASDTEKQRFHREAKAAANLDHPNIVPILDIGEHHGKPFFCMPLIAGQPLSELPTSPLASKEACLMMIKICEAIQHAHERGVIHRDIKPSNILVDENAQPIVLDFGLAKENTDNGDLTRSGMILGTPSFMSPEQASSQNLAATAATDVYGLGAVLYYMLTGQPPFVGETAVDTLLMVIEQNLVSPRTLNPNLDRDLEQIVLRCLQKQSDLRYDSAQAIANDLNAYLNHRPVAAQEGRFALAVGNVMRETHHATVLGNWGVLWMWHSFVLLFAACVTHLSFTFGEPGSRDYIVMWLGKLVLWGIVFYWFRRRMGPVTFVERQVAHVWAAGFALVVCINIVEAWLGLAPLELSPLWAVVFGMTFFIKAGMLSGGFYLQASALLFCAVLMAVFPDISMILFGITVSCCFFFPGLKLHLRSKSAQAASDNRNI